MARPNLVKELAFQKAQQKLWQRVRDLSPNSDPYSDESTLFFYEKCIANGVALDSDQLQHMKELPEIIRIKELETQRKLHKENDLLEQQSLHQAQEQ